MTLLREKPVKVKEELHESDCHCHFLVGLVVGDPEQAPQVPNVQLDLNAFGLNLQRARVYCVAVYI